MPNETDKPEPRFPLATSETTRASAEKSPPKEPLDELIQLVQQSSKDTAAIVGKQSELLREFNESRFALQLAFKEQAKTNPQLQQLLDANSAGLFDGSEADFMKTTGPLLRELLYIRHVT